jgi:lysophospholipase L1-like esterase
MILSPNDHVLFYGDSITDCGRNRDTEPGSPAGWGQGYAYLVAAQLSAQFADWNLTFTNRGNSGDRIGNLEERLAKDVLAAKPNVVSLLIGINDTWRRYDSNLTSAIPEFAAGYRRILTILRNHDIGIVILEPFLLPVPEDRKSWREDLNPRIDAIREVARQFDVTYIPLDGIFAAASCVRDSAYWLPDGVHPSPAGHALIAGHWIDALSEG